jgi:hypothetical protein
MQVWLPNRLQQLTLPPFWRIQNPLTG